MLGRCATAEKKSQEFSQRPTRDSLIPLQSANRGSGWIPPPIMPSRAVQLPTSLPYHDIFGAWENGETMVSIGSEVARE